MDDELESGYDLLKGNVNNDQVSVLAQWLPLNR
jgi:hypothetical protein